MRTSKFRGQFVYSNTQTGKLDWVYGDLVHYPEHIGKHKIVCEGGVQFEVLASTIGQFTGLLDKNGREIYEGDIVRTKYGRPCEVKWLSTPCFVGFDLSPKMAFSKFKAPDHYDLYSPENLEVIGNVYDNPKLLEELL